MLDESASVKELPRQEDMGEGENQRRDRIGNVDDLDRDEDGIMEDNDDMGRKMQMKTNQNFLTVEEQEQKRIRMEDENAVSAQKLME